MAQLYVFASDIINAMYIQQVWKVTLASLWSTVRVCKQITILIFY
jgi:hypothetical protein